MRIGFLWQCVYPWDVRLEKMVNAVLDGGYEASIICKGSPSLPPCERSRGLTIRRLWSHAPAIPLVLKRLTTYPLYFNPLWAHHTSKAILDDRIDLLIVRDIPLAVMGARVGRKLGIPVILDMAENYPAALIAYKKSLYKPFLFSNGWLPRRYEREAVRQVDHVFVVAEEQRQRLLAQEIPSEKLTLVGNTPPMSFIRSASPSQATGAADRSPNLLYVGFLDPHRGADTVIRALPAILSEIPDLTVTLVGDGRAREGLRALAEDLGVSKSVTLPGWISFDRVPEYIQNSAICLIPHLECEHTNTTLPNKLFDYMAFSKPVIAANCRPLTRIIEETSCGVTYKSGDVADLSRAIKQVLWDPERAAKGKNGRRAVELKYNWERDKTIFLNVLHQYS